MHTNKTLTLKKPVATKQEQFARPEKALVGKTVTIQTKSPTRIVGTIKSFDHGWLVICGTEFRWQSDGLLSGPIATGTFTLDRSNITYLCEEGD